MHGSPLLRTMVVLLVLLAAGVPLMRLTRARPAAAAEAQAPEADEQRVRLGVAFAAKPVSFEVKALGKTVWAGEAVAGTEAEKEIRMALPKEGLDLEYHVRWPAGTGLTAARLSVAAGDGEAMEKTLWGTDEVDDVLTFKGP